MIKICSMLGGSHGYNLNTPTSDIDIRGVYIDDNINSIIGLQKNEFVQTQSEKEDTVYTEFRHALRLLKQANTQTIELLFNDNWIECSAEWKLVQAHKLELIDSVKLFNCLRGYMQGERRLANGERTGRLGGKRKESIDKFGFSPKNACQFLRLAWAGSIFFKKSYFPVGIKSEDPSFCECLLDIKTNPKNYEKEYLNDLFQRADNLLVKDFENRIKTFTFNEGLANELCLRIYAPVVYSAYNSINATK